MIWKGTIIENNLINLSVLDEVSIIKREIKDIGISDKWIILRVETKNINKIITLLKKGLRKGWYAVFTNNDRVVIVFKNKSFNIKKNSNKSLARVKNWAFKHYNILPSVFTLSI